MLPANCITCPVFSLPPCWRVLRRKRFIHANNWIARQQDAPAGSTGRGGTFAAYNVLIGYITAHNILPGMFVQALLAIALALHFLGINHTLWIHYRDRFDNLGRWIFAGSLLFGWLVGVMTEFAQTIYIAMYSFLAGAIIVSVFNDELPNRHEGQFWPFLSGVLIYSYLMMNFYSSIKYQVGNGKKPGSINDSGGLPAWM
jgi:hypothetical protein